MERMLVFPDPLLPISNTCRIKEDKACKALAHWQWGELDMNTCPSQLGCHIHINRLLSLRRGSFSSHSSTSSVQALIHSFPAWATSTCAGYSQPQSSKLQLFKRVYHPNALVQSHAYYKRNFDYSNSRLFKKFAWSQLVHSLYNWGRTVTRRSDLKKKKTVHFFGCINWKLHQCFPWWSLFIVFNWCSKRAFFFH